MDGKESQFSKNDPSEVLGYGPYDYGSVMHYPDWGFRNSAGVKTIKGKVTEIATPFCYPLNVRMICFAAIINSNFTVSTLSDLRSLLFFQKWSKFQIMSLYYLSWINLLMLFYCLTE